MEKDRRGATGPAARALGFLMVSSAVFGGFPSTEVFLPAVGRVSGNGGAQFFTTVWATNLTGVAEAFKFEFLKQGQANGSPASFSDTLAPGQTKVYENIVETKLGLTSAIGAARVTSSGEIFVSERIFDRAPGADLGDTQGLFFAGVPKTFSISAGQSASIQGLNQGGSENFRYNFALVETGGGSATVNVQVFDGGGVLLGQKAFPLQPFEQIQPNVAEVVPGFSSVNARITATVTAGPGSILLAGAQLANVSQDSSGFEMSFRDDLLGGGGATGVTSLNALTGALTLQAGNGISVTPSGSSIAIAFTGGGSSGLTSVTHDASLAGAGTGSSPLSIANGQVVRSLNGLHDGVTLAAGSNVTLTPSGSTLTIAASGGGSGGLAAVSHDATLAGNGTGGSPLSVAVPLALQSTDSSAMTIATTANSGAPAALSVALGGATSGKATGISITVAGTLTNNDATAINAHVGGDVRGIVVFSQNSPAVVGEGQSGPGVVGEAISGTGVIGFTKTGSAGVFGNNTSTAIDSAGVLGTDGTGSSGQSGSVPAGVLGESNSAIGVQGRTASGFAGVRGLNSSTADNTSGVFGRDGTGSTGIAAFSAGVRGESKKNIGVLGLSENFAVIGRLLSGTQGELASHREGHDFGVYTTNDLKAAAGTFTGNLVTTGHASVSGNLFVLGTITAGTKDFKIDHPIDPESKYLVHASIESDEMKNLYDGVAMLNESGLAVVALPAWFEALNRSFRYQLTAMGTAQPGLYVAREIHENQFTIAGGVGGAKVSWQVSGVRRDAYARAHPLIVEEPKAEIDRGRYLHPGAFGQPAEKGIHREPDAEENVAMAK